MSDPERQTPLLEVQPPSRPIKKRRALKYFLTIPTIALGLEWNYRFGGRLLETYPSGSPQQRIGFGERLIFKTIQDQFPGEKDSQISEAWWKYNIAQLTAQNNGKLITAANLYAFLFNKGTQIDISSLYTHAILSDPIYTNTEPEEVFPLYIQDQIREAPNIIVTNLPQDASGRIFRGGNLRVGVPATTQWYPTIQSQLPNHLLYVSGKIQSIKQHPAQPPPITGPPPRGNISLITSDATTTIFKSFTAQSAAGYEVSQQDIQTITTDLLTHLPIALDQNWLQSQNWYQKILRSGFSLTEADAQVLINSGNAAPFEIWGRLPKLTVPLEITLP